MLAACEGADTASEDAAVEPSLGVVRTEPFRMTGAFEGESFLMTPCTDSDATIQLEPGPDVLDLVGLHAEMVPGDVPIEAIFVDLLGEAIQDGDDVSFEVHQVYRAGWEDWGCTWTPLETPLRFAASGTEPGWTLHVGADSTVTWSQIDGSLSGTVTSIEGSLAAGWDVGGLLDGDPWTLELVEEPCRNQMSGGWSHLASALVWRGRSYVGCGFIGDATDAL